MQTRFRPDRLASWSAAAAVLAIAAFWGLRFGADQLRAEVREQLANTQKPMTVNGLKIALDAGVEPIPWASSNTQTPIRTLLLVTSDECDACQRTMPHWRKFIEALPSMKGDRLVMASFKGDSLITDLARVADTLKFPVQLYRITNQGVFGAVTGLTLTPTTVILDRQSRIRFISSSMNEAAERHAREVWQQVVNAGEASRQPAPTTAGNLMAALSPQGVIRW